MTFRPLLALALCVAASSAAADGSDRKPAQAAEAAPARSLEELHREADEHYAARHVAGRLDRSDRALEEAAKLAPGSYATLWRQSRNAFWRSEVARTGEARAAAAKRGWDLGEKAVAADPGGAEGHYYLAINAGSYGSAIGVVKALTQGIEGTFLEHLRAARKRAPAIDQGGPDVALGRYHYELPWPKHDGEESERILRDVVRRHPGNIRARFYLAETLLGEDAPAEAKKLLEGIAVDSGRDPAETELVRRRASRLMIKVLDELE